MLNMNLMFFCRLFSPFRLHDVCRWAAVRRVGPFLRHAFVPDYAGPHGAEQGQLGRPPAWTKLGLRGGGAQHGRRRRCPQRRQRRHKSGRKRLQRNTSGKQRILTLPVHPLTSTSWLLTPASGPLHTLGAWVGHVTACSPLPSAPPDPNTMFMFVLLLPPILINHWFYLIYLIFIFLFFWHRAIHRYLIWLLLYFLLFALFYLFVHCSFGITDWTHHFLCWWIIKGEKQYKNWRRHFFLVFWSAI